MKKLFSILLIFTSACAFAQPSALLRKKTAAKLDKIRWKLRAKTEQKFDTIISSREQSGLYKRLDTLVYDVCYIKEQYGYLIEKYFKTGDTVPRYWFVNGKNNNLLKHGHENTFNYAIKDVMKNLYREYRHTRLLQRAKGRYVFKYKGCIRKWPDWSSYEFVRMYKQDVRNEYRILTIVNKKKGKIRISFQKPDLFIRTKTVYYFGPYYSYTEWVKKNNFDK